MVYPPWAVKLLEKCLFQSPNGSLGSVLYKMIIGPLRDKFEQT